jgi:hypothetical protein
MRQRRFSKRNLFFREGESVRQGQAVRVASVAFRDSGPVRCFLNSFHSGLEDRPLDLAVTRLKQVK